MIEISDLIIIFIAFFIGWIAREVWAVRQVEKMWTTAVEAEINDNKENLIQIVIEKDNDMFFVYDKSHKSFMAQGRTREEVEDNLHKRYPGQLFAAHPDNLREIGFKK